MKVAILTISTSGSRGERKDSSGDAIAEWVSRRGDHLLGRVMVTDDSVTIVRQLLEWSDAGGADVVLTTGGTGLSPSDVTPEATRAVVEREAPGIAELIRARSMATFPRAALARGIAGVRGRTLIVNLPGSPGGVRDGLAALETVVDHAVGVLRGEVASHDAGGMSGST